MSKPQTTLSSKPGGTTSVFVVCFYRPEGLRYRVARRMGTETIVYDDPDFITEFAAYVEAARVAANLNAHFDVPVEMRGRLIAYWGRRGRWHFLVDHPRTMCENKYERQAYDRAEAELMAYIDEKDTKPGLTDYVPMTVYPGEYESEVAA